MSSHAQFDNRTNKKEAMTNDKKAITNHRALQKKVTRTTKKKIKEQQPAAMIIKKIQFSENYI